MSSDEDRPISLNRFNDGGNDDDDDDEYFPPYDHPSPDEDEDEFSEADQDMQEESEDEGDNDDQGLQFDISGKSHCFPSRFRCTYFQICSARPRFRGRRQSAKHHRELAAPLWVADTPSCSRRFSRLIIR